MWLNCSGSLIPNLFASDTAGEDAAYGTVGHSVAEQWLSSGDKPVHLIGTVEKVGEFEIAIDETMLDYVQMYVDRVIYEPGVHKVESRVDFSDLTPIKNQRGTLDHSVMRPGYMDIDDLKLGKGVQVFAEENTQLLIYAYGQFREYDELFDFQTIRLRIHQPRLDHFDEWVIDRATLLERAAWIKQRAYAAWCKEAERTPGTKQCQWCKIKSDCAAHAVFVERMLDGVFDDLDAPVTAEQMRDLAERIDNGALNLKPIETGQLSVAQKAAILPYRRMVESWFADIYTELEGRILRGESVPGYKVVEGRSNRVFSDEAKAANELEFLGLSDDVIHPKGMITITQAEGELVKVGYKRKQLPDLIGGVVVKPPGKPTMAPLSDKRDVFVMVTDTTFDNLDETL